MGAHKHVNEVGKLVSLVRKQLFLGTLNANKCPYGAGAGDESPQNLNNQAHLFHGRHQQQGNYERAPQKAS